jgi:Protein kinase domain
VLALVAPCGSCGLHHADQGICPVALVLNQGGQAALAVDETVAGRYRILNTVHRGPMSTVYRVVDTTRGETAMVLKELVFAALPAAERSEAMSWFLREAHLLSTLRHHSLPALHASFSTDERSYLVMEAIPGPSLEMRARSGPLPEAQVLRWGIELCGVLHFLHNQPEPIIYRDLKPSNVLERADTGELVLIDFGVARRAALGTVGTAVGTPGYASPEQYQGLADGRSDIYALGATLHRLLTGYDPEHQDPFRHPPVRELRPDVSAKTSDAIDKALSLAPADRFARAYELRAVLREALPATPETVQATTAPFYFWLTVLPGVTTPLSLVCFNTMHAWLAGHGQPSWSGPALLLSAYVPAVLYLQPLLALSMRKRASQGGNVSTMVRQARRLLLLRLAVALPFWAAVTSAASGGSALIDGVVIMTLFAAIVCWSVSIFRAGQTHQIPMRRLMRVGKD